MLYRNNLLSFDMIVNIIEHALVILSTLFILCEHSSGVIVGVTTSNASLHRAERAGGN